MTSWLVGAMPRPLPAAVLLASFKRMYDLVGFDVWTAHSVTTDAKRSFAHIQQKTIFGDTDKRVSRQCIHTMKGQKIGCEVFIKAIGTRPSHKIDKQLGIKEVVGGWIGGDPKRWVMLGSKGVQAKNFGSF